MSRDGLTQTLARALSGLAWEIDRLGPSLSAAEEAQLVDVMRGVSSALGDALADVRHARRVVWQIERDRHATQ